MNQSRDICRTCLCVGNTTFLSLDSTFSHLDFISIRETISFCMPEFDFDVVPTSVICGLCLSALQTAFTFKKKCDETQERIQEYIDNANGIYHTVDLKKVIDFIKLNSNADLLQKELVNSSNEIAVNDDKFNLNEWIDEDLLETETELKQEVIEIYDISDVTTVKSEPMDYIDELESNGENNEVLEDSQTVSDVENGCKSHKCTVCEKSYKREIGLIAHMRTHQINQPKEESNSTCDPIPYPESDVTTGVKQFLPMQCDNIDVVCKICQKRCYSKSNLAVHMRIHTGVKPFKCDICEKAFTQKVYLTAHERTHHICNVCGKGCAHMEDLNNHMLTHTELEATSPELEEVAADAVNNSLPSKSKSTYEKEYDKFVVWCTENNGEVLTENVLIAYFQIMSKNYKSSTLWKSYSILKSMLNVRRNIDISKFTKLQSFLKKSSTGYEPKKSKILEYHEIEKFMNEAPDIDYLAIKVILIMGYSGACRRYELTSMLIDDIEYKADSVFVTVSKTKTNHPRIYTITNEIWINLIKKYASLRPACINHKRFFIYYRNGRCTVQPIGINKMGVMPRIIAKYLKLQNPNQFSGHCFRRSSASHLANNGGDLITIKRHGGWKSSSVAEGYVDALTKKKRSEVAEMLSTSSEASSRAGPSNTIQHQGNLMLIKQTT